MGNIEKDKLRIEIDKSNELRWSELVSKTERLASLVAKVDYFSSDEGDEFRVVREDGEVQGIFKTWAVPIIPLLESDEGKGLGGFIEDSALVEKWTAGLKKSPMRFWQGLERWRGKTDIYDKRLFRIYSERSLPEDKQERTAELFLRLKVAFGYAAPFYHLESVVVEQSIDSGVEEQGQGGVLDLVSMLLPSALSRVVVAESLDWNGLDWKKVNNLVYGLDEKERSLVIKVARRAGVEMRDVVFAANVLQWIPVPVGGKKDDVGRNEALMLLNDVLSDRPKLDHVGVAREMNALIRFLNWMPLVRSEQNFSDGSGWRYAAVCDTTNLLMNEIDSGGVLAEDFEEIFVNKLVDQVKQLDATSARGRFLLQLMNEGKFDDRVVQAIESGGDDFIKDVSAGMLFFERQEEIVDIDETLPMSMVGGKASGLKEASLVFGDELVIGGKVVTSETIENWLCRDGELWEMIKLLDKEHGLDDKLDLGKKIRLRIDVMEFPDRITNKLSKLFNGDNLAVRSSSFDEDTQFNGTAAGVYESSVRVKKNDLGNAIKHVVKHFFSERAINYRQLHGCSDVPMMAIIVHEFIDGVGGVAFSDGDGWEIVVGKETSSVVGDGEGDFDSYKKKGGLVSKVVSHNWLREEKVMEIAGLLKEAEVTLGNRVDIEFVVKNGELLILQMRPLNEKKIENLDVLSELSENLEDAFLNSLDGLENLQVKNGKRLRLLLDKSIDIDQFQGELFRWLVVNRDGIGEIVLFRRIPRTSHFANICINLGINLKFDDE